MHYVTVFSGKYAQQLRVEKINMNFEIGFVNRVIYWVRGVIPLTAYETATAMIGGTTETEVLVHLAVQKAMSGILRTARAVPWPWRLNHFTFAAPALYVIVIHAALKLFASQRRMTLVSAFC